MRGRVLVGAVVVVAIGLGAFGASGLLRVSRQTTEIRTLEQDLATLRTRSEELTRSIECLRSDPLCIEKSAREDLGMVRQGETILKFPSRARP